MNLLTDLWKRLDIKEDERNTISLDWAEGKVPNLPFLIIDQDLAKEKIGEKLFHIDGPRMLTSIISANYGDGKTNLLKYLTLYFNSHDFGIKFIYSKADPDKTDLCMFLLQHIQVNFTKQIVDAIKELRTKTDFNVSKLANEYVDDFASIREYTEKLFSTDLDDIDLLNVVYLGTGRLYSKGMFDKYSLQKLTDFNRREVLVLLLNILSEVNCYIVFAIDEIEKIYDKSPKRLGHFFTSYREIVDLFNKVHGHYLIGAITKSIDIAAVSQPLYERVSNDIVDITKISKEDDAKALVELMADLLKKDKQPDECLALARKLLKNKDIYNNNRLMVQYIANQLRNTSFEIVNLETILNDDTALNDCYEDTKNMLTFDDSLSNPLPNIFDPLQYYLESKNFNNPKDNISRRDYQSFTDVDSGKTYFFLNTDKTKVKDRIVLFNREKGIKNFVVFVPKTLDLTNAELAQEGLNIQIVEYVPQDLLILLNMYRWNFELQNKISDVINKLTLSVFE